MDRERNSKGGQSDKPEVHADPPRLSRKGPSSAVWAQPGQGRVCDSTHRCTMTACRVVAVRESAAQACVVSLLPVSEQVEMRHLQHSSEVMPPTGSFLAPQR